MSITLSHIPTSEEDLDAQVDQAFNEDEPELEPKPKAAGPERDEVEVEYFPPNERTKEKCAEFITKMVNPVLVAKNLTPLSEAENEDMSSGVAEISAYGEDAVRKFFTKVMPADMSPITASILALGATTSVIAGKRLFEKMFIQNMTDVTPQAPKETREETFQEGEPLHG